MAGRQITISDGGSLVFEEAQANGTYRATIIVDNLTADRTIRIPDSDGTLTGLQPGEVWRVNQGGTGLPLVGTGQILVGSGGSSLNLIDAPTVGNTFLFWDSVLTRFRWAPVNYQANATSARNILSDKPGVYSHVLGSELQFRNLTPGSGILVTQGTSDITIGVDPNGLQVTANNFAGVLPMSKGGTGVTGFTANQIPIGDPGGQKLLAIAAPQTAGTFLGYRNNNVGWIPVSFDDSIPGHLEVPRNKTYMLNPRWLFPATIKSIYGYCVPSTSNAASTKVNFVLLAGSTSVVTGTWDANKPSDVTYINNLTGTPISVGDELRLSLSSATNVADLYFVVNYTR